jgi:hypothetical protein
MAALRAWWWQMPRASAPGLIRISFNDAGGAAISKPQVVLEKPAPKAGVFNGF